jgi:hypothetical protein
MVNFFAGFLTGQTEADKQIEIYQERIEQMQDRLADLPKPLFGAIAPEIAAARLEVERELASLHVSLSEVTQKQADEESEQTAQTQTFSIFD